MEEKPYSEMTEEEAKEWFGYAFKRTNPPPQDVPEAYVCQVNVDYRGSGYGVVDRKLDPDNYYNMQDLKDYLLDYPEMEVPGWKGEPDPKLVHLNEIRTEWVHKDATNLRTRMYETLKTKFVEDDIWNAEDTESPLIVYGGKSMTCDETSTLMSRYLGDDDVKYEELRLLRNAGKEYIRTVVDKFMAEHKDKPEPVEIPTVWVQQ